MSENWKPLDLSKALFANLDEDAVVGYQTAIENGFVNELGGHSRFPGLGSPFVDLGNNDRIYLSDFDGDLIAATSKGRVFRIDQSGNASDVTGVPVSGGRRVIFAKTDRELLMAAGGPIVRLRNVKTELLSDQAPLTTHVGWIQGYTVAIEINSERFFNSGAGTPDQWDPLDVFAADGTPENIKNLIITPFAELLLGGDTHIEQFERLPTGTVPFFRRWSVGDGMKLPYVCLFADNAVWTINFLNEFIRFSGQVSTSASAEIGKMLEQIDDWSDAWLGGYPDRPLHIVGQKFMLLQVPNATNPYDTKGITLLYDYRAKKFTTLYGWDTANGVPSRWPGWSHWTLWNRVFVGGEGKIFELKDGTYNNDGRLQRWLVRTSHVAEGNALQIKDFRLQVVRGVGGSATAPTIRVRCSRDGRPFGPWITKTLGKAGERLQMIKFGGFGNGSHFQWEISSADDCKVNLKKAEVKDMALGH
jgi:hypothetical protein